MKQSEDQRRLHERVTGRRLTSPWAGRRPQACSAGISLAGLRTCSTLAPPRAARYQPASLRARRPYTVEAVFDDSLPIQMELPQIPSTPRKHRVTSGLSTLVTNDRLTRQFWIADDGTSKRIQDAAPSCGEGAGADGGGSGMNGDTHGVARRSPSSTCGILSA